MYLELGFRESGYKFCQKLEKGFGILGLSRIRAHTPNVAQWDTFECDTNIFLLGHFRFVSLFQQVLSTGGRKICSQ